MTHGFAVHGNISLRISVSISLGKHHDVINSRRNQLIGFNLTDCSILWIVTGINLGTTNPFSAGWHIC